MAANPFGTTIPRGATSFYDFSQNDDGQQPVATTQDDGGNGTPAPPSLATPTLNGNNGSSSSSTTTTTTTTVTSPYAQFKGNNYAELEEFLRGQMDAIKPETKEEREKREKREKRIGFLARLAEGLGTFHTAFSHARGIKAMDMPKMSAKAKELFEKAKAQREKRNDEYINYALKLYEVEKQKENEKRRKILEQREDEAYGHGLERRSKTEQLEDAKLRNLENQNDRNAIYAAKNEIYDRYKSGEFSEEEALRQIDRLTKAYNGKWGATYTKSANDKTGTTEKVTSARKEDMSTISDKAPMVTAGRSGSSGGKGGKPKDDRETVTEEEYTVDALGRRTGKRVRKYKVPNGAKGSQGKGAGYGGGNKRRGRGY